VNIPILDPIRNWHCPNCGLTQQTREARPHVRFHTCPKLHMLTAPMIAAGTAAKVTVHEREDYVGKEVGVQMDETGRAVMSVETTRDEGTDAIVFVPTAVARIGQ
jgi:hypothetical protein